MKIELGVRSHFSGCIPVEKPAHVDSGLNYRRRARHASPSTVAELIPSDLARKLSKLAHEMTKAE